MTRQIWREWNFVMLNSNTDCGSITFANRIESTKFIKFLYKVN
jgi:hypothetical protein